ILCTSVMNASWKIKYAQNLISWARPSASSSASAHAEIKIAIPRTEVLGQFPIAPHQGVVVSTEIEVLVIPALSIASHRNSCVENPSSALNYEMWQASRLINSIELSE